MLNAQRSIFNVELLTHDPLAISTSSCGSASLAAVRSEADKIMRKQILVSGQSCAGEGTQPSGYERQKLKKHKLLRWIKKYFCREGGKTLIIHSNQIKRSSILTEDLFIESSMSFIF